MWAAMLKVVFKDRRVVIEDDLSKDLKEARKLVIWVSGKEYLGQRK